MSEEKDTQQENLINCNDPKYKKAVKQIIKNHIFYNVHSKRTNLETSIPILGDSTITKAFKDWLDKQDAEYKDIVNNAFGLAGLKSLNKYINETLKNRK